MGWERGDAVYTCNIRKGNCADFHSLFAAELRSPGIPLRFITEVPLPANKDEGEISGYHRWAKFFSQKLHNIPARRN